MFLNRFNQLILSQLIDQLIPKIRSPNAYAVYVKFNTRICVFNLLFFLLLPHVFALAVILKTR